jgi:hypothetical protein
MDWLDSVEYGALVRRPDGTRTRDIDVAPTRRMIAASVWETDCLPEHITEVAADACLTTHLLAAVVIVGLPRNPMIYAMALEQTGAAAPVKAMHAAGLAAACREVEAMPEPLREQLVNECRSLLLQGWTTLQLDIHDRLVIGVPIARGR